jgi:aminoglycoside phosphotransferase (APT) family kinase protein
MGIPAQRDLAVAASRLADWLGAQLPRATGVEVVDIRGPDATGFSNETLLLDVTWREGSHPRRRGFAVRVAPTGYHLFPAPEFDRQYRLLRWLAENTEVRVPRVFGYEPDPELLGAPFFVMERIEGRVPGDNPPYHAGGWLTELDEQDRARVWWGGIDSIVAVHAVDATDRELDFLHRLELGAHPAEQELGYYENFLAWVEQDEPVPAAARARDWLRDHLPAENGVVLSWGDARIGNIIFDSSLEPAAILDWEMATLAEPGLDVAWTLFMDRHHALQAGVERLPGLPSRQQTIEGYEQRSGRRLEHLDYYEVLSAFRFSVIWARLAVLFKTWGLLESDSPMAQDSTANRIIDELLATHG